MKSCSRALPREKAPRSFGCCTPHSSHLQSAPRSPSDGKRTMTQRHESRAHEICDACRPMPVSCGFVRRWLPVGMTTLSWFVALGVSGCSDTVRIAPARTLEVVKAYSERRESVLWYHSRLYAIREEQRPRLHVVTAPRWKTVEGPVGGAPGGWTMRPMDVPLGAVRTDGKVLYFPGEQPIRLGELRRVELAVDGDPPDGVRPGRERPDPRRWSYRRFAVGAEAGGPAFGQVVVRIRVIGSLHVDLGALAMGAPETGGANASAGLVLDAPVGGRWSLFGGAGAGCGGYFAASGDGDTATGGRVYGYARGGLAVRLGFDRRDQLGVEGAVWLGEEQQMEDSEGEATTRARHFVWPVPGIFWLHTL